MTSKESAQKYFNDMFSVTLDSDDARDCAIIMVKEFKKLDPVNIDYWDEVLIELKTVTRLKYSK